MRKILDTTLIFDIENRKSRLFNISKDPDEQRNVLQEDSETGKRLLTLVENTLLEVNENGFFEKNKKAIP